MAVRRIWRAVVSRYEIANRALARPGRTGFPGVLANINQMTFLPRSGSEWPVMVSSGISRPATVWPTDVCSTSGSPFSSPSNLARSRFV